MTRTVHPSRAARLVRPMLALVLCAACDSRVDTTGTDALVAAGVPAADVRRPNVILFLTDDLGYGDLKSYNPDAGSSTPNMDRLAREGLRFTDAHSPSSVCSPTRYGILTGRYAWRTRLTQGVLGYFDEPLIEPGRMTLASMLEAHGYATAAIGKWHLGLDVPRSGREGFVRPGDRPLEPDFSAEIAGGPLDHGFDYYFGEAGGQVRAFVENRRYVGLPRPAAEKGGFEVPGWDESAAGLTEARKALEFIDRIVDEDRTPFFVYYASHSPHTPFVSAAEIGGTPISNASGFGPRGDKLLEGDAILGLLLDKLDERGIAGDTLVILTSDNGPARRGGTRRDGFEYDVAGGWRGFKGDIWEGGHRVPFIARWGDGTAAGAVAPPGRVSDALIGLNDVMATVADLVGAALPPDAAEDSESFRSVLLGEPCDGCTRDDLLHHSVAGMFAIRQGKWKLIAGERSGGYTKRGDEPRPDAGQLYDLARDPGERENVHDRYPEVVARLTALLERARHSAHTARRLRGAGPSQPDR